MTKSEYRAMLRFCPDKPPCYDCEGKGKSTGVEYCAEIRNGRAYECEAYKRYKAEVNH